MNKYFTYRKAGSNKRHFYWDTIVSSILVAILLGLLAVQSWYDRQVAEKTAYSRLMNSLRLTEDVVLNLFNTHQLLTETVSAQIDRGLTETAPACNPICDLELYLIQKRFNNLLPVTDMLVLDPQGNVLAKAISGIKPLPLADIIKPLQSGKMEVIAHGRDSNNQPAFIIGRALLEQGGKRMDILISTLPYDALISRLKIPRLGEQGIISVLDDERRLIVRKPDPEGIELGEIVPVKNIPRPALDPGSFLHISNVDGVERLLVKRRIPYRLTEGGLTLYLGMSLDDMLAGWLAGRLPPLSTLSSAACC